MRNTLGEIWDAFFGCAILFGLLYWGLLALPGLQPQPQPVKIEAPLVR